MLAQAAAEGLLRGEPRLAGLSLLLPPPPLEEATPLFCRGCRREAQEIPDCLACKEWVYHVAAVVLVAWVLAAQAAEH